MRARGKVVGSFGKSECDDSPADPWRDVLTCLVSV